jgi:hypothetical protein
MKKTAFKTFLFLFSAIILFSNCGGGGGDAKLIDILKNKTWAVTSVILSKSGSPDDDVTDEYDDFTFTINAAGTGGSLNNIPDFASTINLSNVVINETNKTITYSGNVTNGIITWNLPLKNVEATSTTFKFDVDANSTKIGAFTLKFQLEKQ